MAKLTNKVALVTGASKGIGAAIAKALAAEGAAVVVNYASSKEGAEATVAAITAAGGKAIAVGGNVAKTAEVQALVDAAVQTYGGLDILVNNSGVYGFGSLAEFTEEEYRRQFDVNVLGLMLVSKAVLPHLKQGASIINISSAITRLKPPGAAIYLGTKGAVDVMTVSLAKELGPQGIRVNAINPGIVITEGVHAAGIAGSEMEKGFVAQTPLGRAGQPEDIAKVAVYLASEEAGWITGEAIAVSGGL